MDVSTQSGSKSQGAKSNRRTWSPEERERIVQASLKSGTTVDTVARLYGVNASQIYDWRKQCRQATQGSKAAALLPVHVAEPVQVNAAQIKQDCSVVIEAGSARITISGCIDAAIIRTVLDCLAQ